jgi:hypothetical protein
LNGKRVLKRLRERLLASWEWRRTAQGMHSGDEAGDQVPRGQGEHSLEFAAENDPAAHDMHSLPVASRDTDKTHAHDF